MYDIPAGAIAVIVLVGALLGIELAFRWGRRVDGAASDDAKGHINTIQTSTLGILALLLAFTFSLSLQRFESRSDAVVDEANAIGTAYLRAQLLPAALRDDTRRLLREYVDLRVRAGVVATNEEDRLGGLLGQAARLQDALWEHARRSARDRAESGHLRPLHPGAERDDRQLRQARRHDQPARSRSRPAPASRHVPDDRARSSASAPASSASGLRGSPSP